MESRSDQPPLVVILGETASGKTRLAMELAMKFGGEIICADSWTVRRGVNIGTAKPTKADQSLVTHHLLDIVDPCEDFTAAVFKRLANQTIREIAERGKLPIMVGGTGLYIDGVIFDYSFLPTAGKGLRDKLNGMNIQQLLSLIQQHNYSLKGIDIRNKRRLVRLIETGGARPRQGSFRPNTLVVGISLPKDEIESRIVERVNLMLREGLEQEVKALADTYGWSCEALKGIGYHEWREYFGGPQNLDQTKDRIIKDTFGLAKRQRTWFKRNKQVKWICKTEEAVDLVTTFLNKSYMS